MTKPNSAALAAMRRCAADVKIIADTTEQIRVQERQLAVALEVGDLEKAVLLRSELEEATERLGSRVSMMESEWESIATADPIAWADANPREVETPADDEPSGPTSLFDLINGFLSRNSPAAFKDVRDLTLEEARAMLGAHRKDCQNPKRCGLTAQLEARIRELGGTP